MIVEAYYINQVNYYWVNYCGVSSIQYGYGLGDIFKFIEDGSADVEKRFPFSKAEFKNNCQKHCE